MRAVLEDRLGGDTMRQVPTGKGRKPSGSSHQDEPQTGIQVRGESGQRWVQRPECRGLDWGHARWCELLPWTSSSSFPPLPVSLCSLFVGGIPPSLTSTLQNTQPPLSLTPHLHPVPSSHLFYIWFLALLFQTSISYSSSLAQASSINSFSLTR